MNNALRYFLSFFTSFIISYALCGLCISQGYSPLFGAVVAVVVSIKLNSYIRESESA